MSKVKCPCQGCEQRTARCHSECEAYLIYRRENARRNAALKLQRKKDSIVTDYVVACMNKQKKEKRKDHLGFKKGN